MIDFAKKARMLATAGLLALVAATPVAAQEGDATPGALEARAAQMASAGPDQLTEAASLYRKAAALRPEHDPQGVQNLITAGRLTYYAGKRRQALAELVKAADTALRYGDVASAAVAYLDAGWIAGRIGRSAHAYDLTMKGAHLSRSPLLDETQRQVLVSRVQGFILS